MAKIPVYQFDPDERYRIASELLEALSRLKNKDEIFDFLFKLLTASEVLMLSRRFQIAKLLIQKMTYDQIRKKLKVSNRTITDVDKWLRESESRMKLILRIIKEEKKNQIKFSQNKAGMLEKYPYHKLLRDLFS